MYRFALILLIAFLCSCAASKKSANVDLILASNAAYYAQQGDQAFRMQDYHNAINFYRQAIQLYSDQPTHYLNLGACYLQLMQADSAIAYFDKALQIKSNYYYAFMNKARALLQKPDFEQALANVQRAQELNTANAEVWVLTAQIQQRLHEFNLAQQAFEKALYYSNNDARIYHELGLLYYSENLQHQAIEQYDKALQIDSTYAAAWFCKGNSFARLCQMDDAEFAYHRAIQYNSRMFGAFNNLGILYMHKNDYLQAIQQFNNALQVDSSAAPVMLNLSISLQHLDSPNVALNLVNNAIAHDSSFAMFYFQKGNILLQLGRNLQAKQAFLKAMQLDPDYALIYNNLGNSLFELENLDDASAMYQRALELYPEYLEGRLQPTDQQDADFTNLLAACTDPAEISAEYSLMLYNLGKAQLLLENDKAAVTYLRQAVTVLPTFYDAYVALASIYQKRGFTQQMNELMAQANLAQAKLAIDANQLDKAQEYCMTALDFNAVSADAFAELGRIYSLQQNRAKAEQSFAKALQIDAANAHVHLYKGLFHLQNNATQAAADELLLTLQAEPENLLAHENLVHVYQVLGNSQQSDAHKAFVYFARGRAFENIHQWQEAFEAYEQAAQLMPEQARFAAKCGLTLLKLQQQDKAENMLTRALQADSSHVDALFGMGLLAGYRQQQQQAISYFQKILTQDNENAQAHYAIAQMYAQTGEVEKAAAHADSAEKLGLRFSDKFWQSIK